MPHRHLASMLAVTAATPADAVVSIEQTPLRKGAAISISIDKFLTQLAKRYTAKDRHDFKRKDASLFRWRSRRVGVGVILSMRAVAEQPPPQCPGDTHLFFAAHAFSHR